MFSAALTMEVALAHWSESRVMWDWVPTVPVGSSWVVLDPANRSVGAAAFACVFAVVVLAAVAVVFTAVLAVGAVVLTVAGATWAVAGLAGAVAAEAVRGATPTATPASARAAAG